MVWEKGDKFKAPVTVLKMKNGVATVIEVGGRQYRLQHPDHIKGDQTKKVKRK